MAERQKDTPNKQARVIDVTQPGTSAPSASSRPVIVGHRPQVQDPMVNDGAAQKSNDSNVEVKRTAPKVIAPINDLVSSTADSEKVVDEVTEQEDTTHESEEALQASLAAEESSQVPGSADKDKRDAPKTEASNVSKDKGSSVVSAVIDQASKDKDKKTDKQQEELAKRQAEIDKLIEEKKYFVQTSQTITKQRNNRWIAILAVLLLLVGAYLAVDAQLIKNNIKLPYEFFKQEKASTDSSAPAANRTEESTSRPKERTTAPAGWVTQEAKTLGVTFALPQGWTFIDHDENECTKGTYLEIRAPASTISEAASLAGNTNFKKYTLQIMLENPSAPEQCGPFTSSFDPSFPIYADSQANIESGLFKGAWLTLLSREKEKTEFMYLTADKHQTDNQPLGRDPILDIDSKRWVVSVHLDSGSSHQSIDPQVVSSDIFRQTRLYKDTVGIIDTIAYPKDAL